jgi:hypothetical protein
MVMEGYLLLLVYKLGPRRQIRLPGVMLNCVVIIAFPFVSYHRLALSCLALPCLDLALRCAALSDKVFENSTSEFSCCGKAEEDSHFLTGASCGQAFGFAPSIRIICYLIVKPHTQKFALIPVGFSSQYRFIFPQYLVHAMGNGSRPHGRKVGEA